MNFNRQVLEAEISNLANRESEMRTLYASLLNQLKDDHLKERILFVMKQEENHIIMVRKIQDVLC
jgi:rubrerythrin